MLYNKYIMKLEKIGLNEHDKDLLTIDAMALTGLTLFTLASINHDIDIEAKNIRLSSEINQLNTDYSSIEFTDKENQNFIDNIEKNTNGILSDEVVQTLLNIEDKDLVDEIIGYNKNTGTLTFFGKKMTKIGDLMYLEGDEPDDKVIINHGKMINMINEYISSNKNNTTEQ